MYAVIKTGGKQYRVSKDDVVTIERVPGDAGATVEFDQVLMVGAGADVTIGAPIVSGAKVIAELVEQSRGPKLIAFKKRRRKNSRRKKGHRQDLSVVRITDIAGA
jgi:large subunit ribosomal protein L21